MRRSFLVALLVVASAGAASAAPSRGDVTVFLDRDGESRPAQGGDPAVEIPAFGGGDRAWTAVVDCVRGHYAPFRVDIVDRRPAQGTYITAVVGGLASQLGLDDSTTNGVGPYDGSVIPDAVVHVFSQVGTGERDIENVCAVTAHEVGHALGLDHEVYCGDIMSYYLDQCGARTFVDADAPCGETTSRACGNGAASQSSYRQLAANVGLRDPAPVRKPRPPIVKPLTPADPDDAPADPWADPPAPRTAQPADPYGNAPDPAQDTTTDASEDDTPVVQHDEIRIERHAHRGHRHARRATHRGYVIRVRVQR